PVLRRGAGRRARPARAVQWGRGSAPWRGGGRRRRRMRITAAALVMVAMLAGCGFDVQSADLFQVTRTGQGQKLTLLVNDGGTIACNGGKPKSLPDPLLLQARDLAIRLGNDTNLKFPVTAHSVFLYTVKLQKGTLKFPD